MENGAKSAGERLTDVEEDLRHLERAGCPLHEGLVAWLRAEETRRENGDNEMRGWFKAIIAGMIIQLLAIIVAGAFAYIAANTEEHRSFRERQATSSESRP